MTDLLARAQAGDEVAFRELVEPHRRELHVHCYRVLGSTQDAEDALQETLVAAWRGLDSFEARASLRTWLYRVATNRCLNMLRAASRRPQTTMPFTDVVLPPSSGDGDVPWLEPYPDALLDPEPSPQAALEAREDISLAFVAALQSLPPRQRAVLILRDVLEFPAAEVARMLDATEESVTSALKRARATMGQRKLAVTAPASGSAEEQALVARFTEAFVAADVDAIVALLSDDVRFAMPPMPLEYRGPELAGQFLRAVFGRREGRIFRMVPTRANRQPALGVYAREDEDGLFRAIGLFVLTLDDDRISGITRFENGVLPQFGLPRSLRE